MQYYRALAIIRNELFKQNANFYLNMNNMIKSFEVAVFYGQLMKLELIVVGSLSTVFFAGLGTCFIAFNRLKISRFSIFSLYIRRFASIVPHRIGFFSVPIIIDNAIFQQNNIC